VPRRNRICVAACLILPLCHLMLLHQYGASRDLSSLVRGYGYSDPLLWRPRISGRRPSRREDAMCASLTSSIVRPFRLLVGAELLSLARMSIAPNYVSPSVAHHVRFVGHGTSPRFDPSANSCWYEADRKSNSRRHGPRRLPRRGTCLHGKNGPARLRYASLASHRTDRG
jgi:hypothetical protein